MISERTTPTANSWSPSATREGLRHRPSVFPDHIPYHRPMDSQEKPAPPASHDLPDRTVTLATPKEMRELARRANDGDLDAERALSEQVCARFNKGRYGNHLGIVAELATPRLAKGRLGWDLALTRGGDIFHGGAVMSLIDHLSGLILMSDPRNLLAGRTGVTTDFNITLLKAIPPREGLRAELRPLRSGRNMVYMQGDAFGEESGTHVARARITSLLLHVSALGSKGG